MTKSSSDNIFAKPGNVKPFEFNAQVVNVFDDMITRSVPFYKDVQAQILAMIRHLERKPKRIYDLGSSTGSLCFFLAENFDDESIEFIGIDNSEPMIAKAIEKKQSYNFNGQFDFRCGDVLAENLQAADVIVINYVLQFLNSEQRLGLIQKCHRTLNPGGLLVVSEKTAPLAKNLNALFIACHEEFKQKNHYSHLEIAQKRKALENVLVPLSLEENLKLIREGGFQAAEPFLLWHNFAALCAIKE